MFIVVFQVALLHILPFPWLNQKQDVQKWDPYLFLTATNDTYIYDVDILIVLAIGVCVFLTYNTSQAANKKQVIEKQDQPTKRRNIL